MASMQWRLLSGLALIVAFVPAARAASDCDDPAFQRLTAAPLGSTEALADSRVESNAHWLDRRLIQWPGQEVVPGGHFQLVGETGVALDLTVDEHPLTAELASRFGFVGQGVRLRLSETDLPRLPELLKGPLRLVRTGPGGEASTGVQIAGALDDLYAAAAGVPDLGATPSAEATHFKLWAPTARDVHLCRYASGQGPALADDRMQFDPATGVWGVSLAGDLSGQYYRYLVDVFVPGVGWVTNRVTDPYSVSLTADSKRSYVANLNAPQLKPAGWDTTPRPQRVKQQTDMVIYELHLRDFSSNDPTVPAAHRGTYLAFTDAESAGMKHLQALSAAGITDIHLLPVFDFATVPETDCKTPTVPQAGPASEAQQAAVMAVADVDCYNWGYDPFHFGAPEGSYATDAADGARRIVEFRRMVEALHATGLRVGMDMVYNHTAAAGQQAHSVLDRIVPGYYQRLNTNGQIEHSTCCDNSATEHRMMAKLMIDTAVRWARDYRIDSFRFDLMAFQPREAMQRLQTAVDAAAGRHVNLIGEGWNFGEVANGARFVQASQLSLNGSGIGTFSDRGRDAARGGSAGDDATAALHHLGWLNGGANVANADMLRVGLAGSLRSYSLQVADGGRRRLEDIPYGDQPAGYVSQPGEVVNYVENHDNLTLFDLNVLKLPRDTSREDRARVQILGAALTAFSQGVAYFHAGIDLLRSKSMDRNSFNSGDWFNRLDWSGRDNGFAAGLPPKRDNGADYPLLTPLLSDPAIKPAPADIAWTRGAFRDLLAIRASSSLFRMSDAEDIKQRLHFLNTGPTQNPAVIVGVLDGQAYPGAGFGRVLYALNTSAQAQRLSLPEEAGHAYRLHPVHLAPGATDRRVAQSASFDAVTGLLTVPARSALVFVLP